MNQIKFKHMLWLPSKLLELSGRLSSWCCSKEMLCLFTHALWKSLIKSNELLKWIKVGWRHNMLHYQTLMHPSDRNSNAMEIKGYQKLVPILNYTLRNSKIYFSLNNEFVGIQFLLKSMLVTIDNSRYLDKYLQESNPGLRFIDVPKVSQ